MAKANPQRKAADDARAEGWSLVSQHPLFSQLQLVHLAADESPTRPENFWALIQLAPSYAHFAIIKYHPKRIAQPAEWAYVFAHCLLHLGFGHLKSHSSPNEWVAACDCMVAQFLGQLKFGRRPPEYPSPPLERIKDEESLYLKFCAQGIPQAYKGFGLAGDQHDFHMRADFDPKTWANQFAEGIRRAADNALEVAGGYKPTLSGQGGVTNAGRARQWFLSHYPMLGALAAHFKIVEDKQVCSGLKITVAAVSSQMREIYINPLANLSEEQCRFVIAHELLHVGLRHETRCQGRNFFLWNVACDFVINQWLVEMGIGLLPPIGGLYDSSLAGQSAEAIYDRIVLDLKKFGKSRTFCDIGRADMIDGLPDWWQSAAGRDLDQFYRECLMQGLDYHLQSSRGLVPAHLIEEIRALGQPPIPWDVELARWFDLNITPLEKRRTYARLSRRQSASPDIPRPAWHVPQEQTDGRTFGVLLDTSGSMDRVLLAKALGAIASYAMAREVSRVRVVFCDAHPHDQGYMEVVDIAGAVKVRGRGGTVLKPGIDLLEKAEDFPKKAPILIITDGCTDIFQVRREHAFLMPQGARLPFTAQGKVFRVAP